MQPPKHITAMLQMMRHPAFCVQGGVIIAANDPALSRLVPVGEDVRRLMTTGTAEYGDFREGRICLTLKLSGTEYFATVQILEGFHIFSLEPERSDEQLQVLALAAQQLRNPLSNVKAMMDQLLPEGKPLHPDEETELQLAYLYRALDQMQRIIYNMSDANRYASTPARMSVRDVNAVMSELFERAGALCEQVGVRLSYEGTPSAVYTLVDSDRLERCIYNMISNALKHTPKGGFIQASLKRSGNLLLLTIQDSGEGIDLDKSADLYARYLREPSLDSFGTGLGLGMSLIRSCARSHGGAVMISSGKNQGLRLTMSLKIRLESTLASPTMPFDYAGDQDHGLIELADALPPELYKPRKH